LLLQKILLSQYKYHALSISSHCFITVLLSKSFILSIAAFVFWLLSIVRQCIIVVVQLSVIFSFWLSNNGINHPLDVSSGSSAYNSIEVSGASNSLGPV